MWRKRNRYRRFRMFLRPWDTSSCAATDWERGFEKVAIFADDQGFPSHAAQLPNGRWTSKLGKLEDIEHEILALVGVEYGSVAVVMRRPIP